MFKRYMFQPPSLGVAFLRRRATTIPESTAAESTVPSKDSIDLQRERFDDGRPESNVVGQHPPEFFRA
jgi:hypothetical protein